MDKRYLTRVLLTIFVIAAIVAFSVEMVYHFVNSLYDNVITIDATVTTLSQKVVTEAYIVRSEKAIGNTDDVACYHYLSDGEKVGKNQKVAELYANTPENIAILQEISEVEDEISLLTEAQNTAVSYTTSTAEKRINELVLQISALTDSGDYKTLAKLSGEIRKVQAILKITSGQITDYSFQIATLEAQKDELESRLTSGMGSAKSSISGYFYADSDGYENLVDVSDLFSLSYEDYVAALNTVKGGEVGDFADSVGKVVTDYDWYMFCRVENDVLPYFNIGGSYSIVYGSATVDMKLERIVTDAVSETSILVFSCSTLVENMDYARVQEVSLVYSTAEGFEIPASALRVENGVPGVYVLRGSVVQFRAVNVVYSENGMVFSPADYKSQYGYSELEEHDRIIVKGKGLQIGTIVQ